ncbi:hypothetical protein FGO68_gene14919 [Halteria grandinella]|uniref:UBC core domain-containing protein n=1 Tax=Halteria grandinella TaxID=5974 RepID=A0A8J8NHL0_HALGN|nr:hypothetical protein FGO68_gene14919 [Halteria grandinella]
MTNLVRVLRDTQRFQNDPVEGAYLEPSIINPLLIIAIIAGPNQTPFEGGLFKVELFFPNDYPFRAPYITFKTKIYHPNINHYGGVCNRFLKEWISLLDIRCIILYILDLLSTPVFEDSNALDVAALWKVNPVGAIIKAREWTEKYAMQ